MIEEINLKRKEAGADPVVQNDRLMEASQWMAEDSAQRGGLDQHHRDSRGRDVGERVQGFGYRYRSVGEILAQGYQTPREVVLGWMGSPSHKRILLNPRYKEVGSGYVERGAADTRDYWCMDFGSR